MKHAIAIIFTISLLAGCGKDPQNSITKNAVEEANSNKDPRLSITKIAVEKKNSNNAHCYKIIDFNGKEKENDDNPFKISNIEFRVTVEFTQTCYGRQFGNFVGNGPNKSLTTKPSGPVTVSINGPEPAQEFKKGEKLQYVGSAAFHTGKDGYQLEEKLSRL